VPLQRVNYPQLSFLQVDISPAQSQQPASTSLVVRCGRASKYSTPGARSWPPPSLLSYSVIVHWSGSVPHRVLCIDRVEHRALRSAHGRPQSLHESRLGGCPSAQLRRAVLVGAHPASGWLTVRARGTAAAGRAKGGAGPRSTLTLTYQPNPSRQAPSAHQRVIATAMAGVGKPLLCP
jgi:hypothetical protein